MKKKTYEQPRVEVVELNQAEIIATSTQSTFGIKDGEGYGEEVW